MKSRFCSSVRCERSRRSALPQSSQSPAATARIGRSRATRFRMSASSVRRPSAAARSSAQAAAPRRFGQIGKTIHADQGRQRSGQFALLVVPGSHRARRIDPHGTPAIRIVNLLHQHRRFVAPHDGRVGELKIGVAQHDQRGLRLRCAGQFQHRSPDAPVDLGNDERHFAIASERAIDEILDEHPPARDGNHEPPQPQRAEIFHRPIDHGAARHGDHGRAADMAHRQDALGHAAGGGNQDDRVRAGARHFSLTNRHRPLSSPHDRGCPSWAAAIRARR